VYDRAVRLSFRYTTIPVAAAIPNQKSRPIMPGRHRTPLNQTVGPTPSTAVVPGTS
jgi:hypothetical protein